MQLFTAKLLLCTCLISACSGELYKDDATHLTAGDDVMLVKTFNVEALYSHVLFQDGYIVKENELKPYQTSCIFDVNDLGPNDYKAEAFTVTTVNYKEEMYSDAGAVVRYFTEFYLESNSNTQAKQKILTCQVLDDTMQYRPFSASEIKQATGDYFKFKVGKF